MKAIRAAAIYARISSDQGGEGLGVQRQLEDCRKLAADRAWPVYEEYVDNDVSAFSGKPRPRYERMLADIEDHLVDAVLVYHLDRLTRRPVELEHFIEVCTKAGVDVTTVTGDVGLGNDNGLLVARITSAMAAAESGRKSARIKRKMLQNAQMGKPNGGGQRPFGYEPDRTTIRETEAAIIRDLVERYVSGESLNSLARWMNAENIPTTGSAATWRVQTLRPILAGGRIAGIRDHHRRPAATAQWQPIITLENHEKVLAMLATKQVQRRPPSLYLLSGILRCGRCANTLSTVTSRTIRRYTCRNAPGSTGCGRMSVNAEKVEEVIAAAILLRLDSPEFASLLEGRASANIRRTAEVAELRSARDAVVALAEMFGQGEITRTEFLAARKRAKLRQATALVQLGHSVGLGQLPVLAPSTAQRAQSWAQLPFAQQRMLAKSLLAYATVQPAAPTRAVDPARVKFTWAE